MRSCEAWVLTIGGKSKIVRGPVNRPMRSCLQGFDMLSVEISKGGEGSAWVRFLPDENPGRASQCTIVFISRSEAPGKLVADWADVAAEPILRRCPVCSRDDVIGHGRRRKQAHDEHHDWIGIRRGICRACRKTITFLPAFSLPYTHYSLIARSEALRRYFIEDCCWEAAAPPVKDPNRVPDASSLRRWFRALDSSQPPFSFLRRTVPVLDEWIRGGQVFRHGHGQLSWPTVFPLLQRVWPLRI